MVSMTVFVGVFLYCDNLVLSSIWCILYHLHPSLSVICNFSHCNLFFSQTNRPNGTKYWKSGTCVVLSFYTIFVKFETSTWQLVSVILSAFIFFVPRNHKCDISQLLIWLYTYIFFHFCSVFLSLLRLPFERRETYCFSLIFIFRFFCFFSTKLVWTITFLSF